MISVSTNTYIGYGIDDAFKGISAAGFSYIEIAMSGCKGWTEHVNAGMSDAQIDAYKNKLAGYGLVPVAFSGWGNIALPERHEQFIETFELARRFGCKYVVDTLDGPDGVMIEDRAELIAILNRFGHECEKRGLKLVLEVHGPAYPDGQTIAGILEDVDSPAVGINFDTANVIFYGGKDPLEDLRICIDKVKYIHLKDKDGAPDEWNFPAVGAGKTDFVPIFAFLKESGYSDNISVEIEFTPNGAGSLENVNQAVKSSYNYLKSIGVVE